MAKRSGDAIGEDGLNAAVHRFPAHSAQIAELLASDESLRGMCDDLAAAEEAFIAAERLPEPVRAERRAEYADLIEGLAAEIEDALRRAKIVPIPRPPKAR